MYHSLLHPLELTKKERTQAMSQISNIIPRSEEEAITIDSLLSTAKDVDRIMLEAVEAGVESGRSMGVIEAYNLLVVEGYTAAAEVLMQLIEEGSQYES